MVGTKVVEGALSMFFSLGISTEILPLLVFIAVGAMCDFGPLISNPKVFLFGLAAQAGIFLTKGLAMLFGYNIFEAASIGIIGAADGPTSIYVATRFAPNLLGPISVAAYTYMALVPLIPAAGHKGADDEKGTQDEDAARQENSVEDAAHTLPDSGDDSWRNNSNRHQWRCLGFLMFGNLLRESGVTDKIVTGSAE